jgi:uncharacterized protein with GYD domain
MLKMPTFIILGNWTQEGLAKVKETGNRIEQAKKVMGSFGGSLKEIYYTFGRYDFIAITEGPNNDSALKSLLSIAGGGAIRTETLVAYPSSEFLSIIKELP